MALEPACLALLALRQERSASAEVLLNAQRPNGGWGIAIFLCSVAGVVESSAHQKAGRKDKLTCSKNYGGRLLNFMKTACEKPTSKGACPSKTTSYLLERTRNRSAPASCSKAVIFRVFGERGLGTSGFPI